MQLNGYISTLESRISLFIPLIIISIILAGILLNASKNSFVPCMQDCGETFYAEHSAANFNLYGSKYGLLEDNSTGPDIDRKPFLYTHNVNIGSLIFIAFQALGVSSLFAKQLVTLLAFGLGLFYIYRITHYITNQYLIGITALLLFASEITLVLAFGLNALRGWHWLGLFGLAFHVIRYVRECNPTYHDKLGIFLFSFISFCIGYEFLAFSGLVSLFIILFCSKKLIYGIQTLTWLIASVLIIFSLRQLQVIYVLGFEFWCLDLFYSATIKLTFMSNFFSIPPLSEIDNFYAIHNVSRPGSSPAPLSQVWLGIMHMLKDVTLPTAGLGSTISIFAGIIFSVSILCLRINPPILFNRQSSIKSDLNENYTKLASQFYIALLLGITFAMFLFGGLSISIYMKHEFPMLICLFLIPKSIFIIQSLTYFLDPSTTKKIKVIAAALVIFIIVDHVITQIENVRAIHPMSVGWIPTIQKNTSASYVISWTPMSIAAFTENWALGIKQGAELRILDRIKRNEYPFTFEDLITPDQQDTRVISDISSIRPDFWVYFPFDDRGDLHRDWPWLSAIYKFKSELKNDKNEEAFNNFSEAVIANPSLAIASQGKDYMIIDLRPIWSHLGKQ